MHVLPNWKTLIHVVNPAAIKELGKTLTWGIKYNQNINPVIWNNDAKNHYTIEVGNFPTTVVKLEWIWALIN